MLGSGCPPPLQPAPDPPKTQPPPPPPPPPPTLKLAGKWEGVGVWPVATPPPPPCVCCLLCSSVLVPIICVQIAASDGEQVPSQKELRSFHTSWRGGFKKCTGATPRELGNMLRRILTTHPGDSPWQAAAHNGVRSLVFIAKEWSDPETFQVCGFLWHCCRHI